jgi:hypothetical protein
MHAIMSISWLQLTQGGPPLRHQRTGAPMGQPPLYRYPTTTSTSTVTD